MAKQGAEGQGARPAESGSLELLKPLMIDGAPLAKIRFDFDEIIGMRALVAMDKGWHGREKLGECSERTGFLLFAEAVRACHPELEANDLERLHVKDVILAARLGKGFFIRTCMGALTRIGEK